MKTSENSSAAMLFATEPAPAAVGKTLLQRLSEPAGGAEAEQAAPQWHRPRPIDPAEQTSQKWKQWADKLKLRQTADSGANAKKQKMMTVLVAVLTVVFVGVLYLSLGGVGSADSKKSLVSPASAAAATPTSSADQWAFPKPVPEPLRNPMLPAPVVVGKSLNSLAVRGIVYSQNKPSAIVNNQIVEIGHTVNGVTIVNITPNAVEFEKEGQRWTQGVQ